MSWRFVGERSSTSVTTLAKMESIGRCNPVDHFMGCGVAVRKTDLTYVHFQRKTQSSKCVLAFPCLSIFFASPKIIFCCLEAPLFEGFDLAALTLITRGPNVTNKQQ